MYPLGDYPKKIPLCQRIGVSRFFYNSCCRSWNCFPDSMALVHFLASFSVLCSFNSWCVLLTIAQRGRFFSECKMGWIDKVFRRFYFDFHIIIKCIGIMNDHNVLNKVKFYRISYCVKCYFLYERWRRKTQISIFSNFITHKYIFNNESVYVLKRKSFFDYFDS